VPLEALNSAGPRPTLLVVRDDKVVTVPVELGAPDGPRVQIAAGLRSDDQVVVQGKDLVREGQTVKVTPAKSY
jgi:multidrug efflux pump subunit AcrA (membrane-fusion protein)